MSPEEIALRKQRLAEDVPLETPLLDPLDFLPAGELVKGAKVAGEFLKLRKVLNLPAISEGTEAIAKHVNPDIFKMQTTGEISPALKTRATGLQDQINDLSQLNAQKEKALDSLRKQNNVSAINGNDPTQIISDPNADTQTLTELLNKYKQAQ